MGEREQKKESEKSRESNSLKILIKKPLLESENDEIFKKCNIKFRPNCKCKNRRLSRCEDLHLN